MQWLQHVAEEPEEQYVEQAGHTGCKYKVREAKMKAERPQISSGRHAAEKFFPLARSMLRTAGRSARPFGTRFVVRYLHRSGMQ